MGSFAAAVGLVLLLFVGMGFLGGKKSSRESYVLGGRALSSPGVAGVILGALVGGASTVGTAEMAYVHGFSAWWFTLGGGLGCLLLGLLFAAPLRKTRMTTIPQLITARFGKGEASVVLCATALGTFLSVVAQFLAGMALLRTLFPLSSPQAAGLLWVLILGFIFAGGLHSYSMLGKAKILFLYGVLLVCALAAHHKGSFSLSLSMALGTDPSWGLFGRGILKDLSSGLSLVVGVLSTQIYIQALYGAKNENAARKGAFLGALLMPPLGLLGIWIGLSVRSMNVLIPPSQVLPYFLQTFFPPFASGLLWGGILITIIGCAAGLSLGIATNMIHDMMRPLFPGIFREKESSILWLDRLGVFCVTALATGTALCAQRCFILQWSYLSMGIRGAGSFFPIVFGVLFPRSLPPRWALFSSLGGIGGTLLWGTITGQGEFSLAVGMGVSGLLALAGAWIHTFSFQGGSV